MPIFTQPLHEANDCHLPAGSPAGGQFCSTRSGLGSYPYEKGSTKIPAYLKADVLAARRAGIAVYHAQQPEPVKDKLGNILDPLSKSHAKSGEFTWYDRGWTYRAPGGRIFISTRGGEFEPTYEVWGDKYGYNITKKQKDLTPADLKVMATEEDVIATFRHEVGHLQDKSYSGGKVGVSLGREIRAWQYASAATPGHRLPESMIRRGLMSHGYDTYRKRELAKETPYNRMNSWDLEEALERVVQNEAKKKEVSVTAQREARRFTLRVLRSLRNYGAVLRRRGAGVRQPKARDPWLPKPDIFAGPRGPRFL